MGVGLFCSEFMVNPVFNTVDGWKCSESLIIVHTTPPPPPFMNAVYYKMSEGHGEQTEIMLHAEQYSVLRTVLQAFRVSFD